MSWEGGKVRRVVRWQGGKGGRIMRWKSWRGGRVVRWQGRESGRVVKWQSERFLVLFKGVRRVSPRFYLFGSDVDERNKGAVWVQNYVAWSQMWKDFP